MSRRENPRPYDRKWETASCWLRLDGIKRLSADKQEKFMIMIPDDRHSIILDPTKRWPITNADVLFLSDSSFICQRLVLSLMIVITWTWFKALLSINSEFVLFNFRNSSLSTSRRPHRSTMAEKVAKLRVATLRGQSKDDLSKKLNELQRVKKYRFHKCQKSRFHVKIQEKNQISLCLVNYIEILRF